MNQRLQSLMTRRLQELGLNTRQPSESLEPNGVDSCFAIKAPEGFSEHFVDFHLSSGNHVAFAYRTLSYINVDAAESRMDLNFGKYIVSLFGQNLDGELYHNLLDCRVRWIAETSDAEAPSPDVVHIERIEIIVPGEAAEAESAVGDAPP